MRGFLFPFLFLSLHYRISCTILISGRMYHKNHLIVGGQIYDITNYIKNWDDISSSISRNDYDGLEQTFTSKFEFVGQAYTLIKSEYASNYLSSNVQVVFSLRNNSWLYNEKFRCRLHFSEYEDDGYTITVGGIDSSMKSIIKSNGGTEYEIDVDDISAGGILNTGQLVYDGLEIEQSTMWVVSGNSPDGSPDDSTEVLVKTTSTMAYIPLYIKTTEMIHYNIIEVEDQSSAGLYFIKIIGMQSEESIPQFDLSMKFSFRCIDCDSATIRLQSYETGVGINFGTWTVTKSQGTKVVDFQYRNGQDLLRFTIGSTIRLVVQTNNSTGSIGITGELFKLTWVDRRKESINIDLINPADILTAILHRMTGTTDAIGKIDMSYDDRLNNTMLCAAESIRGIIPTATSNKGAKIYTSFNKFRDWMKAVFGYVYEISGNNVTFRHRRAYFDKNTVVKSIKRYNGYNYSVNSGIIYSSVKAGFEEQDYEEVNGRDEFRFGTTYTTGITLTDKELNLISPYRADAIGFEMLSMKRGKNTTDNSSDKNIFMVGTKFMPPYSIPGDSIRYPGYYVLDRSISEGEVSGLISPATQFNLMFTPRRCAESNKEMIGACTGKLEFASSEGNSNVVINGISENSELVISKSDRIFKVGKIQVTIPDIDIPDSVIGVVEIERNGETIRGFIDELELAQGKRKETSYKLIEISD